MKKVDTKPKKFLQTKTGVTMRKPLTQKHFCCFGFSGSNHFENSLTEESEGVYEHTCL